MAKQLGRDWRIVRKYSDMEDFNPDQKVRQTRKAPVMDPVKPIIDQWLMEDAKKKKKFRRTAQRIYDLLKDEYGFKASDRSVRDYVVRRRKELMEENEEAALPLEAKAGTAQVDIGEDTFPYK